MSIDSLTYKSKAKVNLFLHVLSRNTSGFHQIQTLSYFPEIYDEITFCLTDNQEIKITSQGDFASNLPSNEQNIIYKVIQYFKKYYNLKTNVHVHITKNLPIGGGIGGGTSNAATTIIAINKIFNLKISFDDLLIISKKFGSDVPMCMYQQGVLSWGVGEITKKIKLPELPILLINNKNTLLTKDVFHEFNLLNNNKHKNLHSKSIKNFEKLIFSDKQSLLDFIINTKNDLTFASMKLDNNIADILQNLELTNPIVSRMSGSGATCFAIYDNNEQLIEATKKIKKLYNNYWIFSSKN